MADQRRGAFGHGRLPKYGVRRGTGVMTRHWSRPYEADGQFPVAELYPDGYSS